MPNKKAASKSASVRAQSRLDKVDPLDSVKLDELSISHKSVAPFEAATIRWSVRAPEGVSLRLNGSPVHASGSRLVTPTESTSFRLIALNGAGSRDLGAVALDLSAAGCTRVASTTMDEYLAGILALAIDRSDNLYFRLVPTGSFQGNFNYVQAKPVIRIKKDRISFQLALGAEVDWFPNPSVDVSGSFGLAVVPVYDSASTVHKTDVVADDLDVSVSIHFPWYAYAVPGGPIALPIAESMAEDSAERDVSNGIHEFVKAGLNWSPPQAGLIKHAVYIYVDEEDFGTVEIEYCPVPRPSINS